MTPKDHFFNYNQIIFNSCINKIIYDKVCPFKIQKELAMEEFLFEYPVRLDDLDYMGIVGNAEWITILTRARIDLLEKIECPFTELVKNKIGGVVADLKVKFLKPAYFGDKLKIQITPSNAFKKGGILNYLVKNQNEEDCLVGETTIIFVDQNGKPTLMPPEISKKLFSTNIETRG